jgi:hypothetical protein
LFIDIDTRFLIFTTFDGTFANYMNDFINETSDAFNLILPFMDLSCAAIIPRLFAIIFYGLKTPLRPSNY